MTITGHGGTKTRSDVLLCVSVALWLVTVPYAASAQTYTPPRAPWGDPDLQGDYSNKYEQGTPFERPAEFEGRRLDDIKGEELAALIRERAAEVLLNAPFSGGDPPRRCSSTRATKATGQWRICSRVREPKRRIQPLRQPLRAG